VTRRERFLAEMDAVIPWQRLMALIEPHYPKAGNGRQPLGLEMMCSTSCTSGSISRSQPLKTRSTTASRCLAELRHQSRHDGGLQYSETTANVRAEMSAIGYADPAPPEPDNHLGLEPP
jgi:transposase, IS5 family